MMRAVPRRHVQTAQAKKHRATPAAADTPTPRASIGEFIDRRVAQFEWRDAFRDSKTGVRWTYKELGSQITTYAAGLNSTPGGHRGKTLLALTGNAPESLMTIVGAARIGAAASVLDATLAEEVGPAIEAAKVNTLIVPGSFDKELQRLVPEFSAALFRSGAAPQGPVRSRRHPSLRLVRLHLAFCSPRYLYQPPLK